MALFHKTMLIQFYLQLFAYTLQKHLFNLHFLAYKNIDWLL